MTKTTTPADFARLARLAWNAGLTHEGWTLALYAQAGITVYERDEPNTCYGEPSNEERTSMERNPTVVHLTASHEGRAIFHGYEDDANGRTRLYRIARPYAETAVFLG